MALIWTPLLSSLWTVTLLMYDNIHIGDTLGTTTKQNFGDPDLWTRQGPCLVGNAHFAYIIGPLMILWIEFSSSLYSHSTCHLLNINPKFKFVEWLYKLIIMWYYMLCIWFFFMSRGALGVLQWESFFGVLPRADMGSSDWMQ